MVAIHKSCTFILDFMYLWKAIKFTCRLNTSFRFSLKARKHIQNNVQLALPAWAYVMVKWLVIDWTRIVKC